MVYRDVTCPHCGNDTTVKNIEEGQKCKWCRRLILAKFKRRKNGKWIVDAEAIDFEIENTKSFKNRPQRGEKIDV